MKGLRFVLPVLLLLCLLTGAVRAEAGYEFEVLVNSESTAEVEAGDRVELSLYLHSKDGGEPFTMHAMQAELGYDATFLELIPESARLKSGVELRDVAITEDYRQVYLSFLSMTGGVAWEADTLVGTVAFRVIGETGVARIDCEDSLVSLPDGSGAYASTATLAKLVLSTECILRFRTNGGSAIPDQTVIYGEPAQRPPDPTRAGYTFGGWFRDIDLTEAWDFSQPVERNGSLYAKWIPGEAAEPAEEAGSFPWWLLPLVLAAGYLLWRKKR